MSQRQLRAELGALGVALLGAALIAAFDLQTRADAAMADGGVAVSSLSAEEAISSAQEQGADASVVRSPVPVYNAEYGTQTWRVRGDDTAVINAKTGELLEIQFD